MPRRFQSARRVVSFCEQLENRRLLASFDDPIAALSQLDVPSMPMARAIDTVVGASLPGTSSIARRPSRTIPSGREMPEPTVTGGSISLQSFGPESAVLQITGTTGNDVLRVQMENGLVRATVNNVTTYYTDASVTSIWLNGLAGDDFIDVESNTDNSVNMYGDEGMDTLNLAYVSGSLDPITSPVQVFAGADGAHCYIYDNADTHSDDYVVTSVNIDRFAFGGVSFGGLTDLFLYCQTGANVINVESNPEAPMEIRGGPGNDRCRLAPTVQNLDSLGGPMTFVGGVDIDELVFYDRFDTYNEGWDITSGVVSRDSMEDVSYFAESVVIKQGTGHDSTYVHSYIQEYLEIDGWTGDDTVWVLGVSAPSHINFLGYSDNDTMFIERSDAGSAISFYGEEHNDSLRLSDLGGMLDRIAGTVNYDGGLNDNQLQVADHVNTFNGSYTVTSNTVSTSGAFGGVSYVHTNLTLYTSLGNDTIHVHGTLPTVSTAIFTLGGDDLVRLCYFSGNLALIQGTIFVDGGAGDDLLEGWDEGGDSGADYTLTDSALTGNEFATIQFTTLEHVELYADDGANIITVTNSSTLDQLVIGNYGGDFIFVPDSLTPVRIEGGGDLDYIGINHDNAGPNARAILNYSDDVGEIYVGLSSTLFLRDNVTVSSLYQTINGAISFGYHSTYIAKVNISPVTLSLAHDYTQAGYNNGAWNGTAVALSSHYSAGTPIGDGIGYARASDLAITNYQGVPVNAGDVIFTQTLYGDADLNHTVNFNDLLKLAQSYGVASGKWWFNGDFDYNQGVLFPDLLRMAQNYGLTGLDSDHTIKPHRIFSIIRSNL